MWRILLVIYVAGGVAIGVPPVKLDQLKVGSVSYSNVTIVNITPTDLYFSYEKGIKNVKLRLLDPETQKLLNYDPRAAEALERQQAEEAARFQSTIATRGIGGANNASTVQAAEAEKRRKTSEESISDPISERSLIGKAAPQIKIDKWLGSTGPPTLKGKFVLWTFLAPWSLPSQKCVPQLNALQKRFEGKVELAGLIPDADADDRSLDAKLEFPLATDEKNRIASALGAQNVPFVVLVDPSGIVRYQGHPAALGEKELRMLLARTSETEAK